MIMRREMQDMNPADDRPRKVVVKRWKMVFK
jgi:hypothetical protein